MNPAQAARQEQGDEADDDTELDYLDEDEEEDIRERTVELVSRVRQGIRRQPLTAATGAFILGFAVGNGVPKFLARAGIAVGLRLVMQRVFDRANVFAEQA